VNLNKKNQILSVVHEITINELLTAVWRNGGGIGRFNNRATIKHLYLVDRDVLRMPLLPQAAKRNLLWQNLK